MSLGNRQRASTAFSLKIMADIQAGFIDNLIINRERGLPCIINLNLGSFIIDELTDMVEPTVRKEFDRMLARGSVLIAMATGHQRDKIQDESILYEHRKHDGSLPILGVNMFRNPNSVEQIKVGLVRSSGKEKDGQIWRLAAFHVRVGNTSIIARNWFSNAS